MRTKTVQESRPQVQRHDRMFKTVEPSKPVYEYDSYEKVSEMEKVMHELLKFMKDKFMKTDNNIGLEAVKHFS